MITNDLTQQHRMDEDTLVADLLMQSSLSQEAQKRIHQKATQLVLRVRENLDKSDLVDTFMRQYELSTQEGVLLMCLAEALLRIPDKKTAQALLEDKLSQANFEKYFNHSPSLLVNFSSKALNVTADLLKSTTKTVGKSSWSDYLKSLIARSGEPFIRRGALQAMRLLSNKFVMGRTIQKALHRAAQDQKLGYTHSFDMLGEAAMTSQDAQRYFMEYKEAIRGLKEARQTQETRQEAPSISIKLSALHPRYEVSQKNRVLPELIERLKCLALDAKQANISLTIDAEESERLELSLLIFEALSGDKDLANWNGLGLAVQAYQKRATAVIDWLETVAQKHNRRIPVRLVKGAYWDSEIKHCQEEGLSDYPVFTRKASTDLSYQICVQKLLKNPGAFAPAFATHNAQTIATILELAGDSKNFEFQRLHGMGEELYKDMIHQEGLGYRCRIYAPVGNYRDLLPYLVRRLLENGANNSFVNQIADTSFPVEKLNISPVDQLRSQTSYRHPKISLPQDLFGPGRKNSPGIDLNQPFETEALTKALKTAPFLEATPLVAGQQTEARKTLTQRVAPFKNGIEIGTVTQADQKDLEKALDIAVKGEASWTTGTADCRAAALQKTADLMEERLHEFMILCIYEGGKTIPDALAEVREAIDFCRYYAVQGLKDFGAPKILPGPTGERNELRFQGRGTFICISPWNFPLAIFIGQVAAALMAGNAVIAKPAGQTSLVAYKAIQLLLEAGIPEEVLHFVPTSGRLISQTLLTDSRIGGISFTGSTETAWTIQRTLSEKKSALIPFIAETGGQNVMMVDSSALLEQVVADVIRSAFQSAGQRCSALRVLVVQDDIADRLIEMLKGAMEELVIGDPRPLSTDIGPVIDHSARQELYAYLERLQASSALLHQCTLQADQTGEGSFVAPTAVEITDFSHLSGEQFGPILHVIRFQSKDLDACIDQINQLGYGLTFGLHSRLDRRAQQIATKIKAGNVYINRNMIGAIVGSQPFGGRGLSGTGPKAGGPHYLYRFATEQTISTDTTAQGGNTSLMTLEA